ncbi:MAG: Holliday junction branch migration protein RuvA [Olegusella sp.]|nr:Holliday junction branch migration protein RuvA [Olegusella sp.]
MIVQLTGTLVEVYPTHAVLDVGGVGYELGISANTAAALPAVGEAGVTLFTRMIVREDAMELYGFSTRQERALFDRLISISRVGPSLALSTLSTFTPQALATVVATQDVTRMTQVSGVGKKNAQRILMELQDVFAKDSELRSLVGLSTQQEIQADVLRPQVQDVAAEATEALLGMGFAPQEAELALEGLDEKADVSAAIRYALKRLG